LISERTPKKTNEFIFKNNKKNEEIFTFINKIDFSEYNDDLIDLIEIMADNQRFIISDCEEYYQIYFIFKLSHFFNKKLRIVPLFESAHYLANSIDLVEKCILNDIYIESEIEIMLAYSDTTKTGGIIDSVYQLYTTQLKLHKMSKIYNKEILFFSWERILYPSWWRDIFRFFNRLPNKSLSKIRMIDEPEDFELACKLLN